MSYGYGGQKKPRRTLPPYDPSNPPTPEQRAKLKQHVRNSLLWHLQRGDRTRRELELRQQRKRHLPPDVITEVLDEFQTLGYIDDTRVAENIVYTSVKYRALGKRGVMNELRRKGVASDIIDEAVADIDPDSEESAARALVRKRMRHMQRVDPAKRVNQLVSLLARKGYAPGMAFKIVREELATAAPDLDEEIIFEE